MLAYYEICSLVKSGSLTQKAATSWRGPYAHSSSSGLWVGYDDTTSVGAKAEMVKTKGWAGAAIWTLDLDDFNNLCCGGASPLLNTVSRSLRGVGAVSGGCGRPAPPATPAPKPATTTEVYDDGSLVTPGGVPQPQPQQPAASSAPPVVAETSSTSTQRSSTSGWEDYQWKPSQDYDQYEYSGEWAPSSTPEPASEAASKCREGDYYPDPQDCKKFFHCASGKLHLQACGAGLYWNQEKSKCDWADGTQCPLRGLVGEEVEVSEGTVLVVEEEVGGCEAGQYIPVAGDCTAFYQCVDGEKMLKHCQGSLHWNNEKKVPDF